MMWIVAFDEKYYNINVSSPLIYRLTTRSTSLITSVIVGTSTKGKRNGGSHLQESYRGRML